MKDKPVQGDTGTDTARIESPEASPAFYFHAAVMISQNMVNRVLDFYNGIFGIPKQDKARIYERMSRQYLKKGLHVKAAGALKEWTRLEPRNTVPLFLLARNMVKRGKIQLAINAYARILSMEPENVDALYAQTRLFFKRKEFDKAVVETIPLLERIAPDNPEVLYLIAMTYSRKDRIDEAITILKRAVELDEEEIRYHQNLGFLYERKGDSEAAAKCFSRVMELEDDAYDDD